MALHEDPDVVGLDLGTLKALAQQRLAGARQQLYVQLMDHEITVSAVKSPNDEQQRQIDGMTATIDAQRQIIRQARRELDSIEASAPSDES